MGVRRKRRRGAKLPDANATILRSGIHKEKLLAYQGRFDVVPVKFFIPKHDFAQDLQFAKLCEDLNFRDIELAKQYSLGKEGGCKLALHIVCPELSKGGLMKAFERSRTKPTFYPLVEYLKALAFDYKFSDELTDDKLMFELEESFTAMEPGLQKFHMGVKLMDIRRKRKANPDAKDKQDPHKEDKWFDTLAIINKVAKGDGDAN